MKKITEHLGALIAALAGVCLLISIIVLFKAPIGNFFDAIFHTEVSAGNKVVGGIVLDPNDVIFTAPPATEPPTTTPPGTEHIHSFSSWQKVDDTDHTRSCACGATETEAHNFNFVENGDGTKTGTCSKCNHSITVESDVHVCAFGSWTDNGNGTHSRSCSCGAKETDDHSFTGSWTDNGNGTHSRSCICGAKETEEHSYGTGSGDGESWHELYCDDCDYTGWEECEFGYVYDNHDGTHQIECNYCYNGWSEVHTLTWTDKGNGTHREECTVCDYSQSQSHSYEYEVTIEPTEDAEGEKTGTCKCGHQVTETLDKLPPSHTHNYSEWAYDSAEHWQVCSCGEMSGKGAHSWSEWEVTDPATCIKIGLKTRTCNTCGHTESQEIPKADHDYSASCGVKHYINDGEPWEDICKKWDGSIITHEWTDGVECSVCSVCGEYEGVYWCPEHGYPSSVYPVHDNE